MIENFLMGSGVKIVGNLINSWMANSAEDKRNDRLRDAEAIKANVELIKITQKDWISKTSRALIFLMLTSAWCWMGISQVVSGEQMQEYTALVPQSSGWLSRFFNQTELTTVKVTGPSFIYQWWQIMEMMMGAFVVPSHKR